jgi:ABC-type oligopeptide transport system substrate-binding subunit
MFARYGITMTLTTQDWKDFVATRKAGDYTVARNGWLCDYNDPISMLDMWISGLATTIAASANPLKKTPKAPFQDSAETSLAESFFIGFAWLGLHRSLKSWQNPTGRLNDEKSR